MFMNQGKRISIKPGRYAEVLNYTGINVWNQDVISRIWEHDHTVFKPDPDEIINRFGWLHSPVNMQELLPEIEKFVSSIRKKGFTHALLLGMGGSSLAPYLFRETFGVKEGYLNLSVLDSTDPVEVLKHSNRSDPARTLFIVSTKSGGTTETLSFFKYFYNETVKAVGRKKAGRHFVAITDPGSTLEKLAGDLSFSKVFLNDPDIGGRYSALSFFGLVPAALMGIDISMLLERAAAMAASCGLPGSSQKDAQPCLDLGVLMGALSVRGTDKLTLITSHQIRTFGAWLEQLIAESTGKEGKGILPIDGEAPGSPDVYSDDRLFVYVSIDGNTDYESTILELEKAGFSVVRIVLADIYDIGGEFFRWELATCLASHIMEINPFDQPNVESAKVQTMMLLDTYKESGTLLEPSIVFDDGDIGVISDLSGDNINAVLTSFLGQAQSGSYAAIQAYIDTAGPIQEALSALRLTIRDRYHMATTMGYGPRFLHSTGQLHKGDGGKGLFIQITTDDPEDIPIPDEPGQEGSSVSFSILKQAQASGDRQALLYAGRPVIRFHIRGDTAAGISKLAAAVVESES